MNSLPSTSALLGILQARPPPCAFFPDHSFHRPQALKKAMTSLVNRPSARRDRIAGSVGAMRSCAER